MDIVLANPRGFCAGVDRAIDIVNRALEVFGRPVYVRHEVVHNRHVVDDLRDRGAIFVDELAEVPDDAIVIFSAHGVSRAVQDEADGRGLKVFDATCPLVTKVHVEVTAFSRAGRECILIGHAGHPEVEGTMGRYDTSHGGAIYLVEDEAHQSLWPCHQLTRSFVSHKSVHWGRELPMLPLALRPQPSRSRPHWRYRNDPWCLQPLDDPHDQLRRIPDLPD